MKDVMKKSGVLIFTIVAVMIVILAYKMERTLQNERSKPEVVIECLGGNLEVGSFDKVATGNKVIALKEKVFDNSRLEIASRFIREEMVNPSELGANEELNGLAIYDINGLAVVEFNTEDIEENKEEITKLENNVYWLLDKETKLNCIIVAKSDLAASKVAVSLKESCR